MVSKLLVGVNPVLIKGDENIGTSNSINARTSAHINITTTNILPIRMPIIIKIKDITGHALTTSSANTVATAQ